jgi:hypothetical protein
MAESDTITVTITKNRKLKDMLGMSISDGVKLSLAQRLVCMLAVTAISNKSKLGGASLGQPWANPVGHRPPLLALSPTK